jgi:glycosyltransferase involved in cell wall biosynthesis
MKIAIAAESTATDTGLGHFLRIALGWLADCNPNWEFHVVAGQNLANAIRRNINLDNITVYSSDQTPLLRITNNLNFRGKGYLFSQLSNKLPFESWKAQFGNTKRLWKGLPEFDVIWVPHFPITTNQWPLLYERNFSKGPILFTVHDLQPLFYPNDWPQYVLGNFYQSFLPFMRRQKRIVTHTNFQKKAITGYLGVSPDKVIVVPIPPLTNPTEYALKPAENENRYIHEKYKIDRPYLFYASSTGYTHKNHINLFLAWKILYSRLKSDCPLLVCTKGGGAGRRAGVLNALIEELGLREYVRFIGSVNDVDLPILNRNSTSIICPTLYEGGGSGPVAEGILAGRPVLCSRIPPIEEQMEAYGIEDLMYFDPYDANDIADCVQTALDNLEELDRLAKRNQKILAESVPHLWKKWAEVYSRELKAISLE